MKYTLPALSYAYNSLEPYLDEKTMRIHHIKHHQAYVNNTNDILYNSNFINLSIDILISQLDIIDVSNKIKLQNNAGGHANHSLFWTILKLGTVLEGDLKIAIKDNFGSITNFKEEFERIAINHFGSGWVWLVKNNEKLSIVTTVNQNNPLMGQNISGVSGFPILCLDIWEHAYYLKYQNRRMDYIRAFWNVINWDEASKRFNR
ncbi:MAG: Fe-Mn family superoxide dismutase [Buchnera aphidicola (Kaburagia rhusicola ensigallis)]